MESDVPNDDLPRGWFRFSILNLLLLTTVVVLGITVAIQATKLGPLSKEVNRLKAERDELHVVDPTKINAVQLTTNREYEWKWKVWIPEGVEYGFSLCEANAKAEDVRRESNAAYSCGEIEITYRIEFDPLSKIWKGKLYCPCGQISGREQAWVGKSTQTYYGGIFPGETQVLEPEGPILLKNIQVVRVDDGEQDFETNRGFSVWLAPYVPNKDP